jgi:hypothetical protein
MTTTAFTVTARKPFTCPGYRCRHTIDRGETYVVHVAFPNDETNQGTAPWSMKICAACQAPAPMPARRQRRARRRRP